MASKLSSRLDRVEKTIAKTNGAVEIIVTLLSGGEAEKEEREFILNQAKAALGLCEPSDVIFVSTRVGQLEEEVNFPNLTREDAEQLILEYSNG